MEGIVKAGILKAFSGKVNLIRRENLPDEWDPTTDNILCVWEATQYLIKRLEMEGEYSASSLLKLLKHLAEVICHQAVDLSISIMIFAKNLIKQRLILITVIIMAKLEAYSR